MYSSKGENMKFESNFNVGDVVIRSTVLGVVDDIELKDGKITYIITFPTGANDYQTFRGIGEWELVATDNCKLLDQYKFESERHLEAQRVERELNTHNMNKIYNDIKEYINKYTRKKCDRDE